MIARVHDPKGPWRHRWMPALVLMAVTAVGSGGLAIAGALSLAGGVNAVIAALALGMLVGWRRRPRTMQIDLEPGALVVRGDVLGAQRVTVKDVVGATTGMHDGKIALSLTRTSRQGTTTTIEVDTEAEADQLRQTLGIGHHGFGDLVWHTGSPALNTLRTGCLVLATLAFACGAAAFRHFPNATEPVVVVVWIQGLIYALIPGFIALVGALHLGRKTVERPPSILMRADGVAVYGSRGWATIPYVNIGRAEVSASGKTIDLHFAQPPFGHPPGVPISVSATAITPEERELIVAQLTTATARARGFGKEKRMPSQSLDVLRRGGDSLPAWLARLDVLASSLDAHGYRAVSLSREDLDVVLSDPDAPGDLRAAAARILLRVEPAARVRVEAALASLHDDEAAAELREAMVVGER